jgi:hypothetical protein
MYVGLLFLFLFFPPPAARFRRLVVVFFFFVFPVEAKTPQHTVLLSRAIFPTTPPA